MGKAKASVEVVDEQHFLRVDKKRTARLIGFVLEGEKSKRRGVTLLVADDRRIAEYHGEYLGDKSSTDVIAFGLPDRVAGTEKDHLGDVVVSAETAKRESSRYGKTPGNEFERYVVHGLLHLLGYRDKKKSDHTKMHGKQEAYLEAFGCREKR